MPRRLKSSQSPATAQAPDLDGLPSHVAEHYAQQFRLFERMLSSITDFTYTFDLDGRFTFINKPLLDLWGLTLEQAVGKNFFDLSYPHELATKLQRQIREVIDTKQLVVDETPYTSLTGAGGYYQYIFSPVLGTDGSVEAVAGSTRDITSRKRAEDRERFQLALDKAVRPLTSPAEIMAAYARLLGEFLQVDRCAYCDVEADEDTFNLTGDYNRGVKSIVGRYRFSDFGQAALDLMRADKPFVVDDIDTHLAPIADPAAYRATQIQAVICVPMHKNGKFVASMAVHQKSPRQWRPDEIELVRGVAARCWESIERARVVRALRENEEFHRFAAEAGRTGSWYLRLDTGEYTVSTMMAEMMDLPNCQTTANAEEWRNRILEADRPAMDAAIARAIAVDAPFDIEFRIRRSDGSIRWLYSHGGVVRDASDNPVRLHGASVDRTEHKHAEDRDRQVTAAAIAAAEANAKFRAFFDQGTYFAGVMTLDGTIIEANRLCLEACGYRREDVIGKKFWDCGWWNREPQLVEMVREATREAASGRTFRRESEYYIADGSKRYVELVIAPVTDDAGRVLFIAPTGTDITERKLLADERERLLQSERTARAEAEAANRAKDKFIAVLSHELRTPLSPVTMTIPFLESDPDMPEKFREDLAMVRRNIELEVKLIDDLLDMSRVASGKLRLESTPLHAHEVLMHAVRNSMSDTAGKHLNLRQEFNATNDSLRGDPARLQQVFWNLLRNAVKFTAEDGHITVRTWNPAGTNAFVVEVKDTGVGIPADVLPRIFDAFEQGEARVTRQFGGLGLGLAIAKAVTEMHGGTIAASSAGPGRGAAFRVQFVLDGASSKLESDLAAPSLGASA